MGLMDLLRRREGLLGSVRDRLDLPRDDRVVTHADTADGGVVVASVRGLHLLPATGPVLHSAWVDVDRASWQPPVLRVELADGTSWEARLPAAGTLPRELRVRVDATIVWSARHRLSSLRRGGVRIVARRSVGGEQVRWRVWPDQGVRLEDPLVRVEVDQLLDASRASLGGEGEGDPADAGSDDGRDDSPWAPRGRGQGSTGGLLDL